MVSFDLRCSIWTLSCGIWDLVPWPRIEPGPPALGVQSLGHRTTREVPTLVLVVSTVCLPFNRSFCIFSNFSHGSLQEYWSALRIPPSLEVQVQDYISVPMKYRAELAGNKCIHAFIQQTFILWESISLGRSLCGKEDASPSESEYWLWVVTNSLVSSTPLGCYRTRWSTFFQLFHSVQCSRSVVSNSLQPHEPQHARPPCPSPTPRVHPHPCPLSQW